MSQDTTEALIHQWLANAQKALDAGQDVSRWIALIKSQANYQTLGVTAEQLDQIQQDADVKKAWSLLESCEAKIQTFISDEGSEAPEADAVSNIITTICRIGGGSFEEGVRITRINHDDIEDLAHKIADVSSDKSMLLFHFLFSYAVMGMPEQAYVNLAKKCSVEADDDQLLFPAQIIGGVLHSLKRRKNSETIVSAFIANVGLSRDVVEGRDAPNQTPEPQA